MKATSFSVLVAVLALALSRGVALPANEISGLQYVGGFGHGSFPDLALSDATEAGLLRNAYAALSTGVNNYEGHRGNAMERVKMAAKLLGVDLSGDRPPGAGKESSDYRLRQARATLHQVRDSAAVRNQVLIQGHLDEAIHQIDLALRASR